MKDAKTSVYSLSTKVMATVPPKGQQKIHKVKTPDDVIYAYSLWVIAEVNNLPKVICTVDGL